jgi:hypothetical protein
LRKNAGETPALRLKADAERHDDNHFATSDGP